MSDTAPSGDIEQLEKLALALLVSSYKLQAPSPRLFPGKIPENFPIEIPLPEQSHVLGTLVRSETQVEIVLESDLPPQEILKFYRTHLVALGWQEPEEIRSRPEGGFLHSDLDPDTNSIFCQQSSGAGLTLQTLPLESATTTVRLNISLDRKRNPCASLKMRRLHHRLYEMIPSLTPPAGAQQQGGGGGSSGSNEAYTTATLKTALALDVLAQHYADQLSQAGWTQTGAGINGPAAWHTWHFTEGQEPWSGMFFILKTPEKSDEYFTFIRTVWTPSEKNRAFAGWLKNS